MEHWLARIAFLIIGFLLGVGTVFAFYLAEHSKTQVYTTKVPLVAEGIHIPAGTELIHHSAMSEGFDVLRLYISVQPYTLGTSFESRLDPRSFLVVPYDVTDPEDLALGSVDSQAESLEKAVQNNS